MGRLRQGIEYMIQLMKDMNREKYKDLNESSTDKSYELLMIRRINYFIGISIFITVNSFNNNINNLMSAHKIN